jgi:hypothetical protein
MQRAHVAFVGDSAVVQERSVEIDGEDAIARGGSAGRHEKGTRERAAQCRQNRGER